MNRRLHSFFDDDVSRDTLSTEESAQLREMERTVDAVVATLRTAPAPDLVGRVMNALPAQAPAAARRAPAWRRGWGWLWRPHPLRLTLRPAYALAALLAALAAPPLLWNVVASTAPEGLAAGADVATPPRVYVQFRLQLPEASSVELAGSFTNWQPRYELHESAPGVWTTLVPLRPGVHDYAFVVDGKRWVADPAAPQVDDSFGGTNSRLSLPPPSPLAPAT